MEAMHIFKSFNRNKSIEEFEFDTKNWKRQIEYLQHDISFLMSLLDHDIYKPRVLNLFETLQMYKKEMEALEKEATKMFDKLISHQAHVKVYVECDNISCDNFFNEVHTKIEYDVDTFLQESNTTKQQIFEFIKSAMKN